MLDGPTLALVDRALAVDGLLLELVVYGRPKGYQRVVPFKSKRPAYHTDDHIQAEERIRRAAIDAWGGKPPLDAPVLLEVDTWHMRPKDRCRVKDRGRGPEPYGGRPDASNIVKLVEDAMTKAGVWVDDARVADLVVRRRYLPLDLQGLPVGVERTEVRVWAMGAA